MRAGFRITLMLAAAVAALALGRQAHAHHYVAPAAPQTAAHAHPVRLRHHRRHPADPIDRAIRDDGYISRGTPHRKEIALTFDDGPGPQTRPIVRWLHARGVAATFFVIGRNATADPRAVREEARDGFAIGDHTQDHAMLGALSATAQSSEIDETAHTLHSLTGRHIRLFRPPYGSFDADTLRLLRADRMLMVLWSVDTKDYARPGVPRIIHNTLAGVRAGEIILMHDGGGPRQQTLAALPRIVHHLRMKGYRLVTVPQLLAADPPPPHQPPPHSLSGG